MTSETVKVAFKIQIFVVTALITTAVRADTSPPACPTLWQRMRSTLNAFLPGGDFRMGLERYAPGRVLGKVAAKEEMARVGEALNGQIARYYGNPQTPVPRRRGFTIARERVFFAQGNGPVVSEVVLRRIFTNGHSESPRLIEVPLPNGEFVYLVYDGHHRLACEMLRGQTDFDATVWMLADLPSYGVSREIVQSLTQKLTTHLEIK